MFLLKIHEHKEKELKIHASLIKSKFKITENDSESIEGIFILGGDGTILRYLRNLALKEKPYLTTTLIIAVNFGSFGCLAPFDCKELGLVIDKLISKDYKIIQRKRLKIKSKNNFLGFALNDILITSKIGVLNKFIIQINGNKLKEIRCDSVLISTQSGSSGYNYSGKGPFLTCQDVFVVNCLNPCQVNFNPLVVSGNVKISLVTEYLDLKDVQCVIDGYDDYKGINEFSFELESGSLKFMAMNDECNEYVKIANRLFYLK
ncbi:NAD(+) kinase [Tubulinosema ratisbonensis]|uniref:NAD(+) kinase n=1 Tax=Tubulinosema ratisbonensis TaxID=291195 RepID=A0A437AMG6_9MICR|nr:NAD(+) kinase [Tubulinosema ratisbonensis]